MYTGVATVKIQGWVSIEKNHIRFKAFILERILTEKNERKLKFFFVSKMINIIAHLSALLRIVEREMKDCKSDI